MLRGTGGPSVDERRYRSVWQDLRGVEFRQRWIDAGSISTRVLEAGRDDQPALIFIHGTGGHAETYTRNLGEHGRYFHTYAIDLVGHGFSDKPNGPYEFSDYVSHLVAFFEAEGIESASLSGESMGAGIAGWFAYTYPERVDRLVLNTGAGFPLAEDVVERFVRLSLEAVRTATWDSVKERLEFLFKDPADVTQDLIDVRLAIYRQDDMLETLQRILERHTDPAQRARNEITEDMWRAVKHETLVLWTTDDPTSPPERGREVASWIPNSKFVVMEDCGHWPQFEDPATFNRIHLDFLLNGIGDDA